MSMNTGHPTHPLFKSVKRGWEDSAGSVRVLTTLQLMGLLATRIGGQARGVSPFSSSMKSGSFLAFLASVAGEADPEGFRATSLRRVARSTDVERVRDVAKVR